MSLRRSSAGAAVLAGVLVTLSACNGSDGRSGAVGPTSTSSTTATTTTLTTTATPVTPATVTPATAVSSPGATTAGGGTTVATSPEYSLIVDPEPGQGLDFGFLTGVSQRSGVVTITFDRATFTRPRGALDDYRITDTNPKLRTFRVEPRAAITGVLLLLDDESAPEQPTRLTLRELVTNANRDLATKQKVPVWLRHTNGLTGPVTGLAEQFLP